MEIFKELIKENYGIGLAILLIYIIITNIDKIRSIIPNSKRKLEELKELQENNDFFEDITKNVLDERVRRITFKRATKFYYSQRNIKLLKLREPIKDRIELEEFKKISKHIKNTKSLEKIENETVLKEYRRDFRKHISLMTLNIFCIFLHSFNKVNLPINNFEYLCLLFFCFVIILSMYLDKKNTLNIIRKYDKIIDEVNK